MQQTFPWTRIKCSKGTICILEIMFCRRSMCQEKGTYVLNEFRQSCTFAVLLQKNHIYHIILRLTWAFHQHFIKTEQIWNTNTKYKMTVQHSWFNILHQVLERSLLKPNTRPQVHNRPLCEYPNKSWQDRGSMWQQVSWTMHTCTMVGQTAHSSLPALLACGRSSGGCQAQELAVLLVQISARTISKNHTELQWEGTGRNREEYRSLIEFWILQNIKAVKRASSSTTSSQRKAQPVSLLELPSCLPEQEAVNTYLLSVLCCLLVVTPLEELYSKSFLATATHQWKGFIIKCSLNQMKGRVRDTTAALETWGIGHWQRRRCSRY